MPERRQAGWWPGLGAAALLAGCSMYGHLTETGTHAPPASECGDCHVAIHEEWRDSPHARAWTSPAFVAATAGHRFEGCLGCHAPESVHVTGQPVVRAAAREEGVHCTACHLRDGAMVGPAPSTSLAEVHPVVVEAATYHSSELCGTCHVGTYEEWLAAPEGDEPKATCQACHMPAVTRKNTQATSMMSRGLVHFEDPFEGRRHLFQVGPLPDGGDLVQARLADLVHTGTATRCRLEVTGLIPHRIPTGDFGERRIRLEVLGRAGGTTRQLLVEELYKELGTALVPGEVRSFAVEGPPGLTELRLRLDRTLSDGEPVVLFEAGWPLP
jgi:hypothetical protein